MSPKKFLVWGLLSPAEASGTELSQPHSCRARAGRLGTWPGLRGALASVAGGTRGASAAGSLRGLVSGSEKVAFLSLKLTSVSLQGSDSYLGLLASPPAKEGAHPLREEEALGGAGVCAGKARVAWPGLGRRPLAGRDSCLPCSSRLLLRPSALPLLCVSAFPFCSGALLAWSRFCWFFRAGVSSRLSSGLFLPFCSHNTRAQLCQ